MRASIALIRVLAFAAAGGFLGCMPTDVGFMPPSDVDGNCQQLTGNIIIRSASDARSLPQTCFTVAGDVDVVESDLTDLEQLRFLRQASKLRIRSNDRLVTTAGLDQVKVVEQIDIDDNPMLEDVVGLDRTLDVEQVSITSNPLLVSLVGLRSMQRVGSGGLSIRGNRGPEDLKELESLLRVEGSLRIEDNEGFSDLETFRLLDSVGELVVSDNKGLANLEINVIAIPGDLRIDDNPELQSFAGFGDLERVGGNVTIQRNGGLVDLRGFSAKFTTIGKNLSIDGNPALTDIYDLAVNLISVGGSVIATNNPLLSQCRAEDLDLYIEDIGGLIDIGDNSSEWDPCA